MRGIDLPLADIGAQCRRCDRSHAVINDPSIAGDSSVGNDDEMVLRVFACPALPRDFYRRHPTCVAPELLNKILLRDDGRAARIVEVEAYAGSNDPAAHSYRGQTARNASMFGKAGLLYVYLSYGMHWASNVVCGEEGEGVAVLLRAAAPMHGVSAMRLARPVVRRERDLASGPGKLAQAFGITRAFDGADLVTADRGLRIVSDGMPPPSQPIIGPRIGISKAVDFPWRWYVADQPHVSVRTLPR